jgi:NADPH-dependent 2,4-dienoyl-CoA reductase/sulfur reductase-like enzyme
VPDVVAVGDVARVPSVLLGGSARIEHWTNAVEMASHAARRLLRGASFQEPFASVPYFWSDQYNVKLQVAGRVRKGDDFAWIEDAREQNKLAAAYGRGGVVTAVLAWNRPQQLLRVRRLIAQRASLEQALVKPPAR